MNKLMMICAVGAAILATGCTSDKVLDGGVKGMYVNGYTETLAIGAGRVTSIPGEREAMAAHYREDTAWLSPSTKTHELDLFLVGTNSVENAEKIVDHICQAFKEVAPTVSSNQNTTGGTVLTYFAGNHRLAAANEALKIAGNAGATNAVEALVGRIGAKLYSKFAGAGGDASKATVTTTTSADGTTTATCTDGSCTVTGTCTDGSCNYTPSDLNGI